jgi:hypothetical protein
MQDTEAVRSTAGFLLIGLVAFAILLIPTIFYLLTLQKAFNRCSPENRAMNPVLVWLMLIPLFNMIWHFMIVLNMSKSLAAEFQKRGLTEEPKPGQNLGLAMCILFCTGIIPVLGMIGSVGALVCWILYWVKIAGYSKKLEAPAAFAPA